MAIASSPISFTCSSSSSLLPTHHYNLNQRSCLFPIKAYALQRCRTGVLHHNKLRNLSPNWGLLRGNLEAAGVPTSVPLRVAFELLQAGHRYLDVRTPEEFSAGHVPGAINVPYIYRVGSAMMKNLNFLVEVSKHFRKDDEIIIGCKSGKRSLMAASDLLAVGFTGITDIAGGYDGWSRNGLPTEF